MIARSMIKAWVLVMWLSILGLLAFIPYLAICSGCAEYPSLFAAWSLVVLAAIFVLSGLAGMLYLVVLVMWGWWKHGKAQLHSRRN